jgi:ATP-dependent DNA helicase RecG
VYSILRFCEEAQTLLELLTLMRLKDRTKFRKKYLYPLLEFGAIQLTIPDKPKSKNQKYRLTAKGLQLKKSLEKNK